METTALILICFWSYFVISFICFRLEITKITEAVSRENGFEVLNMRHILGIIIFSITAYVFFNHSGILLLKNFMEDPALSISVAFFATISMDLSISDATSQNINLQGIPFSMINGFSYIIIRLIFLFAYEIFFRGVLFIFSLQYVNLVYAIFINLFLYALIHGFDSRKEIIGSLPFGIVLCMFTYYSGSIWPAFIIHASLSLGFEAIIISKGLTKIQKS
ncbi:MAG: CPBP family intramembrane glutamic endopeptidase [Christiangramia sp.]|nr:CPBP family intramembrane glutamic endopeptidase [Christiangramia sp.]